MDSDIIMSATANASVGENAARPDYWRAFAPTQEADYVLDRVSKAVEKPHLSIKSQTLGATELRAQFEGRLGVAGVIHGGEVEIAFPFVKGGRGLDVEILEVISGWGGKEGWVIGASEGVRFCFYDVLRSTRRSSYERGERREFVMNALALSLRRVKALHFPTDLDGGLHLQSLESLRMYVPQKTGNHDQGSFQSPIDGPPKSLSYDGREYKCLPISLGDEDGRRVTIDLLAAPEIAETLGSPLELGNEIAGVVWLQGYAPEDLEL